ncbi:hypothetical protein EUTSA_v10005504mg, partial [Eutrema salsugineum]
RKHFFCLVFFFPIIPFSLLSVEPRRIGVSSWLLRLLPTDATAADRAGEIDACGWIRSKLIGDGFAQRREEKKQVG